MQDKWNGEGTIGLLITITGILPKTPEYAWTSFGIGGPYTVFRGPLV